jgi:hypothetical protein
LVIYQLVYFNFNIHIISFLLAKNNKKVLPRVRKPGRLVVVPPWLLIQSAPNQAGNIIETIGCGDDNSHKCDQQNEKRKRNWQVHYRPATTRTQKTSWHLCLHCTHLRCSINFEVFLGAGFRSSYVRLSTILRHNRLLKMRTRRF